MKPPFKSDEVLAAQSFVAARHHFFHDVVAPRKPGLMSLLDRVGALVLLIRLAPVLAVVAVLIWRCDGAPVLFGHYRIGRDGQLFRCLKFRSMYRDSDRMLKQLLERDAAAREEWARDHKLSNDPRITPIGHFLRRTSLDELPQLFNVLRGEMSLVGPRPITVAELPRYGDVRWHYLSTRPGMTGLWQVSGRNDVTYEERVEMDRRYVEGESWRMRLAILWRTVSVVMHGSGAR
jgi:exopolysaccharide production protein ExoY